MTSRFARGFRVGLSACLVVGLFLTFSADGRAQASRSRNRNSPSKAQQKQALRLLKKGLQKLQQRQYSAALKDFQRGYEMHRHFAFPMFIGACMYHLGRPRRAMQYYREARQIGGLTPRHRKTLLRYESLAKKRLKYDIVHIETIPKEGVEVLVDAEPKGSSPFEKPLRVEVGRHKIDAYKEGYGMKSRPLVVKGGKVRKIKIELDRQSGGSTKDPSSLPPFERPGGVPKAEPGEGSSANGKEGTKGSGGRSGISGLDGEKRRSREARRAIYDWTALGLAAAGVAMFVPGGVYLGLEGKKAEEATASSPAKRYTTQKLGIGFSVAGGVLLVASAVVYGLGWLNEPADEHSGGGEKSGQTRRAETNRALPKRVNIRLDPSTGTAFVGAGWEF